MGGSRYLSESKALIAAAKEQALTVEERREKAVELAALMLGEARRIQTHFDRKIQAQLARMMQDLQGRVFTTNLTDQCFRSKNSARVADQCSYLLDRYGIPTYLPYHKQLQLVAFKWIGASLSNIVVPLMTRKIRKETASVILPGERPLLLRHILKRRREGARININHLGEAILGEDEAKRRFAVYLEDLRRPEVEYISVKISTIVSQLNLLPWEETLEILSERLKELYRMAMRHTFVRPDGKRVQKFVNLDMEEYRDLHLTVALFQRVLDEPEFLRCSAGIVLQAYLPDTHFIQQELTVWAMKRLATGGAPIKIRLVKGANLAMEQVEASLNHWPQAPYTSKAEVDANYKRMLHYGCLQEHARAVRIGVASHNLFDIAYAMLLSAENRVEDAVDFEMLEGMADPLRRVVQELTGSMVIYCPTASKEQFQYAVAYLIRRLQENTAPDNFLRHIFGLLPGTQEWQHQADLFSLACHAAKAASLEPRRKQNRNLEEERPDPKGPFISEPNTDWSLPHNRKWISHLLADWKERRSVSLPIVISGKERFLKGEEGIGKDPSLPKRELYRYTLATEKEAEEALSCAKRAESEWSQMDPQERSALFAEAAHILRQRRGEVIACMVADGGKTPPEADVEVSEAIDFLEYYRREAVYLHSMADLRWRPRGTVLITPPWNFPCAIPMGGVASALAAGNCVIFKPSRETTWVGWQVAKVLWDAGVSREVLQFLTVRDTAVSSLLVKDPRIDMVILTGATETAKKMFKMRPGLHLAAETGGKNAIIVTAMADRDLAVQHIIQSAFGHAGQKCSACSLLICEEEVYLDPHFRQQLKDATASMRVGSAWDLATRINPLIHPPTGALQRGLTLLEEGEEWLLEPTQDPDNPNLWSPGIKWGVTQDSFSYQNELFGPVLSVMRAKDLEEAIAIANGTAYGLTSGIQTLDEREQKVWLEKIEAGNCYINRGITGAVVLRQPFGGTKQSSFGRGLKVGGPNYLTDLMEPEQIGLPQEREVTGGSLYILATEPKQWLQSQEERELWQASLESYQYYWKHYFSKDHDPCRLVGQDNLLRYLPHRQIILRLQEADSQLDLMRVVAAASICGTPLEVSGSQEALASLKEADWLVKIVESEEEFLERIGRQQSPPRIRLLKEPSEPMKQQFASCAVNLYLAPVLANGRFELLHYLREVSISYDYHRYGNLGEREGEARAPVL